MDCRQSSYNIMKAIALLEDAIIKIDSKSRLLVFGKLVPSSNIFDILRAMHTTAKSKTPETTPGVHLLLRILAEHSPQMPGFYIKNPKLRKIFISFRKQRERR